MAEQKAVAGRPSIFCMIFPWYACPCLCLFFLFLFRSLPPPFLLRHSRPPCHRQHLFLSFAIFTCPCIRLYCFRLSGLASATCPLHHNDHTPIHERSTYFFFITDQVVFI
ncbi:hypothetical protein K457DRAFT_588777 [Linnemannia elongata AG-77]|uniref:Uncharacterized protein n=1 Tax=Linnemannia elongata AG-77 TaxID=1314771 RepID=A0A197JTA6_9FUNG|nr:hypothetical protein K457DRAFT_588777 [Linnemannia elongata AG-77]